jgi:hypothetical protein
LLGGAVAVAALLGACSGRGVPSDFAVYRGQGYSVGYPSAWKGCHGTLSFVGTNEPAVEFSGPAGKRQIIPPFIQVADEGVKRTFDHALKFHRLLLQVNPGYKKLSENDVKVSGAKRAVQIEFRQLYPEPTPQGQPDLHGINLLAEAPDGSVVSMLLSATATDFGRLQKTFDDVVRSLAVGSDVATESSTAQNLPDCSATGTPSPSPSASG